MNEESTTTPLQPIKQQQSDSTPEGPELYRGQWVMKDVMHILNLVVTICTLVATILSAQKVEKLV